MFGRAKKELEKQVQATKEEQERNRRAYAWKARLDKAKGNEHETTRVFVAYQIDLVIVRIREIDQRSAAEMGECARTTHKWFFLVVSILILEHFWR